MTRNRDAATPHSSTGSRSAPSPARRLGLPVPLPRAAGGRVCWSPRRGPLVAAWGFALAPPPTPTSSTRQGERFGRGIETEPRQMLLLASSQAAPRHPRCGPGLTAACVYWAAWQPKTTAPLQRFSCSRLGVRPPANGSICPADSTRCRTPSGSPWSVASTASSTNATGGGWAWSRSP